MADTETKPPVDPVANPATTLQNATEQAQAEIEESVRKQESVVYAAARAKVANDAEHPPIDGDERTRTLTLAVMNNAPTGIVPGLPGGQNPVAHALAKGETDVAAAVEQVAQAVASQEEPVEEGKPEEPKPKKAPPVPKT